MTAARAHDELKSKGFTRVAGVLDAAECAALAERCSGMTAGAGTRCLLDHPWCASLADRFFAHESLAALLPRSYRAVQCTFFEKSLDRNWLVPLHQDLSIPVDAPVASELLRGWSQKEGRWHVQPPQDVLQELLAIRLHLDPCLDSDGGLRLVPGSHRHGVLDDATALALREAVGTQPCEAAVGDAMVMLPLTLHASSKSTGAGRRRVLHFLFGPQDLPLGLKWRTARMPLDLPVAPGCG